MVRVPVLRDPMAAFDAVIVGAVIDVLRFKVSPLPPCVHDRFDPEAPEDHVIWFVSNIFPVAVPSHCSLVVRTFDASMIIVVMLGARTESDNVRASPVAPCVHVIFEVDRFEVVADGVFMEEVNVSVVPVAPCVQVRFEVVRFEVVAVGAFMEVDKASSVPVAPCVHVRFEVFIFEDVVLIAVRFEVVVELRVRVVPVAVFQCVFDAVTLDPMKFEAVTLRPVALDQLRFEVTNPFEMVRLEATNRLHATKLQKDP